MPRILIVDDEDSVRALLRIALEEAGYDVSEAATAETAVALYEARPADLVITDIFMPEADAMAKILDLVHRNPTMKVIAVSGAASEDTAVGIAKLLGARQVLQKPFMIKDLLDVVQSQLAG
jgi:two-component system response regulator (stage 0 sporulation protein F)